MTLALDFKSATLYAVRIVLNEAGTASLREALAQRMADAGSFFENEPVVIDASRVEGPVDWPALLEALRGHNLPAIGVVADGANLDAARAAGLVPVELSAAPVRPAAPAVESTSGPAPIPSAPSAEPPPAAENGAAAEGTTPGGDSAAPAQAGEPEAAAGDAGQAAAGAARDGASQGTPAQPAANPVPAAPASAMVVTRPLRSGQRVYARQSDLIVIGMVSQGAEVIADGNIHVYGPLRGKAMAGARGDTSARIFTTQLDAELLAVAGIYRVVEAKLGPDLHNRPALVSLDGETLQIQALKA